MERTLYAALGLFLMLIAIFYAYVAVHIKTQREARAIEHVVTGVERSSQLLLRKVIEHIYAKEAPALADVAPDIRELHAAVRDFRSRLPHLQARMNGAPAKDASDIDKWLLRNGFLSPPQKVTDAWSPAAGAETLAELLKTQASLCIDICMEEDLPTARKLEIARKLETVVEHTLSPRLEALREATIAWHVSAEDAARAAAKASVAAMIVISLIVFATRLLPAAKRVAASRQTVEDQAAGLASEVERQTAALREALHEAEAGLRAKTAFLRMISHETRTPMNGVLGAAAVLDQIEHSPEAAPFINAIQTSGGVLMRFIENWTEMAEIAAEGVTLSPRPVQIDRVVSDVALGYEALLERRGVALVLDIADHPRATFAVDDGRIARVLRCLLDNAATYTDEGFVTVSYRHEFKTEDRRADGELGRRGQIEIKIADTGCGIPPKEQIAVFKGFERLDMTRGNAGAGLGLSIASEIVSAMGGRIDLWSRENVGSIFTVSFAAESVAQTATDGSVVAQNAA